MPNANTNTTATLQAEKGLFYDRNLLERLVATLVWARWAQKKGAPKKSGDTISFRRFESLQPTGTPLVEGVTPDGKKLTVTEIKAVVEQYGDYVEITDKIDTTGIDPVLTEASDILGEMAGTLLDDMCRDCLCTGTNVLYAGGKTERAAIAEDIIITCFLSILLLSLFE